MSLSLDYKLQLNELIENNPTKQDPSNLPQNENYPSYSNVRNVNFVLLNGDMIFLNYAYLVSGRYLVADNKIVLAFTSDKITLLGVFLRPLYFDLMHHIPAQIIAQDARYNATAEKDTSIVNEITIKENDRT